MINKEDIITKTRCAEMFNISESLISQLVLRKKITCTRLKNLIIFTEADLETVKLHFLTKYNLQYLVENSEFCECCECCTVECTPLCNKRIRNGG